MFENVKKVASKLTYAVPVVVFLGFVFYITTFTYTGTVQKTVDNTKWSFNSFVALSDQFEKVLQDGIYKKYGFINLNGRIAKYLGFNSLNNVLKLKNGYLEWYWPNGDLREQPAKTIELNKFLAERGIQFLYVLAPAKITMYDVSFAPGHEYNSRKNQIEMIDRLKIAGVNVISMDDWFEKNGWHMEDVFFKTDHHWNQRAGLAAAQQTMEWLHQQGLARIDNEKLQSKNYRVKVLKGWFLGSQGRRTGKYYAGVDDFDVFTPKFETSYYFAGLSSKRGEWLYSNSLLDSNFIKKNLFERSSPYMHGLPALRVTRNTKGLNDRKVLVIGDSFRTRVEFFLTTQFKQVYSFDTRINTDETLAQYIEELKPDVVVMCMNSRDLTNKELFKFGVSDYSKALAKTKPDEPKILLGDFEIPALGKNNNFVTIESNLEPGQTYTITVDGTEALFGNPRHIQITLINQTTNEPVTNHYFEIRETDKQKWIFNVPKNTDNYAIYLYAGIKNHTADTSVIVKNVRLRKGIFED